MRRLLLGLLLSAALTASGCSGSSPPSTGPAVGQGVFSRACSACHSLVGNESLHRSGGDLLGYGFSAAALTQYTRVMPLRRPLSAAQTAAVVAYLLRVQRGSRARGNTQP